ncbi:MAG: hypothetical protein AB7V46_15230 [Thermomicrobiales bacterium]
MISVLPAKLDLHITQRHPLLLARRWQVADPGGSLFDLDTTGYAAALTVRTDDASRDVVLAADEADYIALGWTPAPWQSLTAYGLGQFAIPRVPNGFIYQVTAAGTSDAGEPTWPETIDATVPDDGVQWTCISTDWWQMNCYVHIPSSVTGGLEDWGAGTWSLELTDPFGHTQQMLHGAAWLQRSAT